MCTQFLDGELLGMAGMDGMPAMGGTPGMGIRHGRLPDMATQLQVVVQHAWGGGFNYSSEAHEGKSCFSKAVEDKIDARVTDPRRWQEETRRDASFILQVPWKSTGMTVRKVVEGHLKRLGALRDVAAPGELASLFISMPKGG